LSKSESEKQPFFIYLCKRTAHTVVNFCICMKALFRSIICSLLLLTCTGSWAQMPFLVSGRVLDARSGEPVPFANVSLLGRPVGTLTNDKGLFSFSAKQLTDSLIVSSLGFSIKRQFIDKTLLKQIVEIRLEQGGVVLQEVRVRAGENPAYRVLRQVWEHRPQNDYGQLPAYEYDSYTKTDIALRPAIRGNGKSGWLGRLSKRASRTDSVTDESGRRLLPLLFSEAVSHFFYLSSPLRKHEEILKTRVQGVGVKDAELVSQVLGSSSLHGFNFYHNYLSLFGKDFASPIGDNGRAWYDYFIADTILVGERTCYVIDFDPKRVQDLVFRGKMWVDTANYALCHIEARVGREANLNFVEQFAIESDLDPVLDTITHKPMFMPSSVRLMLDITGSGKNGPALRARIVAHNGGFVLNQPHNLKFYDRPIVVSDTARKSDEQYWAYTQKMLAGADSLNLTDRLSRRQIDSLRAIPAVKRVETMATILTTGYLEAGKIDIGPYPYALAYNSIEGLRLQMGFRTNEKFSRHFVLRGYLAYGLKDQKWKQGGEFSYRLPTRNWGVVGVKVTNDIARLGLTPEAVGGNKLFYAFSRFGKLRGAFHEQLNEVYAKFEPVRGVMLTANLSTLHFNPYFAYQYNFQREPTTQQRTISELQDTRAMIELRLAQNETYLMDGNDRITLSTKRTPVVTLRYTRGFQGLSGDFSYNRFSARAFQTFRLGIFGRSNAVLAAGYTPDQLPVPLLFPHTGNPTWFFNSTTFNLMNFYEFVSDRYASLQVQHNFEGLLFNRIPGIRNLGWRLTANAGLLVGTLSTENQALIVNRATPDGRPPVKFGHLDPSRPYIEAGYGIENIFHFLKIVAVHRLTYREGGSDLGYFTVKASAQFSF
jgi:hypothetical protein